MTEMPDSEKLAPDTLRLLALCCSRFLPLASHAPVGPTVPPQAHVRWSNPLCTDVNDGVGALTDFSCVPKVAVMVKAYHGEG